MKRTKRPYVLKARGDQMAETRARIVAALIQLHQKVGPSQTTVSAVAELAKVERLTVYRHFQDEAEMLAACSHRYFELNPPPNPAGWAEESDPVRRVQRGLGELYDFFSRTAPMFTKVYRDVDLSLPVKKLMVQFDANLRAMADGLAATRARDPSAVGRRTILRHATKFATWQSLETEEVDNQEKVALMLRWLDA